MTLTQQIYRALAMIMDFKLLGSFRTPLVIYNMAASLMCCSHYFI